MSFKEKIESKGDKQAYRWQKILEMNESVKLWDISTGKLYTVGQFVPIHLHEFGNRVEEFKIKGSDETVVVAYLRRLNESRNDCSIGGIVR